jgi:histidyl-tRNA synthetase
MFRAERPQAGRQRQFYQVGVEAIGSASPLLDAEVVALAWRSFDAMGLRNFSVRVNSIGDRTDRDAFRAVLTEHMRAHLEERCEDCKRRFVRNVFRMLDCKERGCQASNAAAPHFVDHLRPESRTRFDATLEALTGIDVPFELDPGIVRGFDYYTHTVFEVQCPDVGARSAVCGGGRYDTLIPDMGGPELGATGFAIGVTPTLLALEKQGHPAARVREPVVPVFVAPVTDAERPAAFRLCDRLRRAGLETDTDFENKSLKGLFKAAGKRGVALIAVLGPDEVATSRVQVKDLRRGEEFTLADDDHLANRLRERLAQGD